MSSVLEPTHDHGRRISTVETQVSELKADMKTGFGKVNDGVGQVYDRMNSINQALTALQARQPVGWDKVIGTVQSLAVLFAMICAGIIYVASGITNKDTAALREDLAVIKFQLSQRAQAAPTPSWTASVEPSPPPQARR